MSIYDPEDFSDLDQFIEEAETLPNFELSDEYIIGGYATTIEGNKIRINKDVLTIMLNRTAEEITEDEKDIISNIFDQLGAESGFISIEYDMGQFKEDIIEFVSSLMKTHFPQE